MNIAPETREELKRKVVMSSLGPVVIERVLAILSQDELTPDNVAVVRELIQNEIEADFAKIEGLNAELNRDVEYMQLVASHERELAVIEEGANRSVDFVEMATGALNAADLALNDLETSINIDIVRGRLQMG